MQHFTEKYSLSRASQGIKIVTTIFLFFMVPGFVSNLLLSHAKTGWSYSGLIEYYRGLESGYPKTYLELLETTHFHIFSMPVVFLILAHVFLMCSWSYRWKIGVVILSFFGIIIEISGPWLITYVSPQFGVLMVFSGIVLAISLLIYIFIPIYEMWFMRVNINNGNSRNSK